MPLNGQYSNVLLYIHVIEYNVDMKNRKLIPYELI